MNDKNCNDKFVEKKSVIERLGYSYLRVLRSIVMGIFCEDVNIRHKCKVYFTLLAHAYHTPGEVKIGNRRFICQSGELITSIRQIEKKSNVPFYSVREALNKLEKENLITRKSITYQNDHYRVNGYLDITRNFIRSESSPKPPYSPPAAPPPPGTNTSGIDQEEMKRRIKRIHKNMAG